MQLIDS